MAESEGEAVDKVRAAIHDRFCKWSQECADLTSLLDRLIDAARAEWSAAAMEGILEANDKVYDYNANPHGS